MEVALRVAELHIMTVPELRKKWLEYFDVEPPIVRREFYINRLAYRIQELEYGGLPKATRDLLINMHPKDIHCRKKLPPVGTRIIKNYKGKEYTIRIIENGFEFNGMSYKNLSSIALAITGQKLSGYSFFGLDNRRKDNEY